MQVFKFGGASVNSVERIQMAGRIIASFGEEKLLVIISAMGKTTNALEQVTAAFFEGNKDEAIRLFHVIKEEHLAIANELLQKKPGNLDDLFTEVEWLLHDAPVRQYDYYYDQIVCIGELLSTSIISAYLNETGVRNQWVDVRDIIRTDDNFRDAGINWEYTNQQVQTNILPLFANHNIVMTQGFIGATDENESTTLGREGSDYTAAVFANLLDAKAQVIWKDVTGVMNADPKTYGAAQLINALNYNEVIEMAFYGAQVIHPKTIKPLQNKQIPLWVKCFLEPSAAGTYISGDGVKNLPPIIVIKQKQVMLEMKSKDFSFMAEKTIAAIYQLFEANKLKPNLTQNTAIRFICVMDDHPQKIEELALQAANIFDVTVTRELTLLTIRHFNNGLLEELSSGKKIILKQETTETVQVLMAG